jgi:1A family penicillin-binding protein
MTRKRLLWLYILIFVVVSSGFSLQLPAFQVPQPSVVYDVNGKVIKGLSSENQIVIPLEDIPDSFKKAVIAVEDKNFYSHHGVDPAGILRALIADIKAGEVVAGGSTITQQTAKILYLTNERTLTRKIKELWYTIILERKYSKDEILALYCNSIYFGQGATGIEVAARTFFGKEARQLTVPESTLLAGLPNYPSGFDPYVHPDRAKARQEVVLERMAAEGYITQAERDSIAQQPLKYKRDHAIIGDAPYFVAMIREYLIKQYGENMVFQGGLKVYTTLDLTMQQAAERALAQGMKGRPEALQGALVAVDVSNGQIRAMVGGRDFTQSSYNRVFATRQPGSTFKPFMYSLALSSGWTQADMIPCEEVEFPVAGSPPYKPTDYGDEPYHWRDFTLKEAVMKSDNVVAVTLNERLGPARVARYAENFGFSGIKPVLSLPLGSTEVTPLQMAAGYAAFANKGVYSAPYSIIKVVDSNGKVMEENRTQQKRSVSVNTAYLITDMLTGVMQSGGTGAHLRSAVGRPCAGKTGTTDEFKDAWFVGYTPYLCCAVWVGYDDNRQVNQSGGVVAGPIWANFLGMAGAAFQPSDFPRPEGIKRLNICMDSGLVAVEACPRPVSMAFISGTEPGIICYWHQFEIPLLPELPDWLNPVPPEDEGDERNDNERRNEGGGEADDEPGDEPDNQPELPGDNDTPLQQIRIVP